MVKKRYIAYLIFTVAICYVISPWIFEKKILFNELLSATGAVIFIYKRFRFGRDAISIGIVLLLIWGSFHIVTSLFRMDNIYYYLRNTVIIYSVMTFFIGYYLLKYLDGFISFINTGLKIYLITFLFLPVHHYFFERFSTSTLFPALVRNVKPFLVPSIIVSLNIVLAINYDSSTAIILAAFYIIVFIAPGYKFFKQVALVSLLAFICVFIYLLPNLDLIKLRYSPYTYNAIYDVINSHPLLAIDGNSTWRLVLWKQIIVDLFPYNLLGFGFGTPLLRYYPVEDFSKLDSLPYILGAHNSYVYLFGRLGLIYILLILGIYAKIFKEYFYHKVYYLANKQNLIFLSFFAISVIALFNPTLESPIYAGMYWLLLGFTARCIHDRHYSTEYNPR